MREYAKKKEKHDLDLTTTSLWFRVGNATLVVVAKGGQGKCRFHGS